MNRLTGRMTGGSPGIAPNEDDPPLLSWSEDRFILVSLFLLACSLRIGLAVWTGLGRTENVDAYEYYLEAVGIVDGKGLVHGLPNGRICVSAFNMPMAPLLLSCGMSIFGATPTVARLVAIVFGSLSAPLLYSIARAIMLRRWALLVGLGCAGHPIFLYSSIQTLTEPFYIPSLFLAVLLGIRAMRRPGFATACTDGVAWGLAALCRPHAVPALVLTAIGMGIGLRSWRSPVGLIVGMVLVLTPWWARNLIVFGKPVLLSLEGGETFLGSNNPYVVEDPELAGLWIPPMSIPEYRSRMIQCDNELDVNNTQMGMSFAYLRSRPRVIPGLVLNKMLRWLTPITNSGGLNRIVVLSTYGTLLVLVILGVVFGTVRCCPLLLITLAVTLADLAIVGVYWGNLTRGRIALELIWLPWGVQTFRLLVAKPVMARYRKQAHVV